MVAVLTDIDNTTGLMAAKYLPPAHEEHACYPQGSNGVAQYLIGYGSLMQKESKERTYSNTGDNVPIRVYGFERSWTCKGESVSFSTTYLGVDVSSNKSSYLNAVYFKIPSAAALQNYDTRESFYCREEVVRSKVQLLASDSIRRGLPVGQYWIYVTRPEYRETPTEEYPIVQSYVDTFLSGCLELETNQKLDGFADECVQTTRGWESPWVNDRIYPRRPFLYQRMAGRIDGLLNKTVHDAFKKIRIEG